MGRVIGIVGMAHCGSTALSRLLEALPQVTAPGELHWLVDLEQHQRAAGLCSVHGKSCPVFTTKVCAQTYAPRALYSRVLRRSGKSVLVSSDKSIRNYVRFVKPGRMTALILYKRPMAQAWSTYRSAGGTDSYEAGLALWKSFYYRALGWAEIYAKDTVVVSLERFMRTPYKSLKLLAARLGLRMPEPVPRFDKIPYHHVRGNIRAHRSSRLFVDRRWRTRTPKDVLAKAHSGREIRVLLNGLDNKARQWS